MPQNYNIYNVFLGSPAELAKERKIIKKDIEKIKIGNSRFRCIMWENDLPVMRVDDFQKEVDIRLLESADIAMFIFRKKLGSLGADGVPNTVHELERALALGLPVMLYFIDPCGGKNNDKNDEKNNDKIDRQQIEELKQRYRDHLRYFECSGINGIKERLKFDLSANLEQVRLYPYDQFIGVLSLIMNGRGHASTRYDIVLLTIPDSEIIWNDEYNDITRHFLDEKRNEINGLGQGLLSLIIGNDKMHFINRTRSSLIEPYTYRYFDYFFKMFRRFTGAANDSIACDELSALLRSLCGSEIIQKIFDTENFIACLDGIDYAQAEKRAEYLSICFNKLVAAIMLMELGEQLPDHFTLKPQDYYADAGFRANYGDLKREINNQPNPRIRIELYSRLYALLRDQNKELIDLAAGETAIDFFEFVNNPGIQDLLSRTDEILRGNITSLYNLFYENVKYKLYRNYDNVNRYNGFMRYDLEDRSIVKKYMAERKSDIYAEHRFQHIKPDHLEGNFVIRQATNDDIDNIIALNNPTPPYRRAIYVKSDDNEIKAAVRDKEVWVIEEIIQDGIHGEETRNLACVAVILDSGNDHDGFNTDKLTKEYADGYKEKVKRDFRYLDFDSVLTNDGRSRSGRCSYRGCGFQRMMLILAENLALERNCDYVCATVSTFNKPSMRNFILNGYYIADQAMYGLEKGAVSQYYAHIMSNEASEAERKAYRAKVEREYLQSREILNRFGITRQAYEEDREVPRNFVVLQLAGI